MIAELAVAKNIQQSKWKHVEVACKQIAQM